MTNIIKTSNLSVTLNGVQLVQPTSVSVNAGEAVGIIGLNDMEMAKWENINLTTIRQPIKQIVDSSVELVIAALEDRNRHPEARLFSCQVMERGTLRPL